MPLNLGGAKSHEKNLLITSIAFSILSLQFSCQTTTGPAKTPGSGGYVSKGDLKKAQGFRATRKLQSNNKFRTLNLLPNFVDKTLSTAINSDTTEKVIISKNQSDTAKIHLETFMGQIKGSIQKQPSQLPIQELELKNFKILVF